MAEAWHKLADGFEIKAEQTKLRQAAAPFALGVVPIVFDLQLSTTDLGTVPVGGEVEGVVGSIPGVALGDTVFVNPIPGQAGVPPNDQMYDLTLTPPEIILAGTLIWHLQNRTAAPITPAAAIGLRFTIFHFVPAAPAYPPPLP
jgi:hypothetical protein